MLRTVVLEGLRDPPAHARHRPSSAHSAYSHRSNERAQSRSPGNHRDSSAPIRPDSAHSPQTHDTDSEIKHENPTPSETHRTLQDLALHREFDVNCKRKSDQPTFPAKQRVRRPQTEPIIPAGEEAWTRRNAYKHVRYWFLGPAADPATPADKIKYAVDVDVWTTPMHPASPFSSFWECTSGILLLYTTAVTPLLIAFFSEVEGFCQLPPTIKFDLFVDTFFLTEILIHFLTAIENQGAYISKLSLVCITYLKGQFLIDLIGACPIAYIEYFTAPNMSCKELVESGQDVGYIRYLRFIRVIRLLRAFKVLKIFTVLRTVFRFRPTTIQLLKCAFFVCMLAHLGGCIWWFMKTALLDAEQIAEFKEANIIEIPILSSYIVAVYFLMCTLCTVGYGDISADTDEERVLMTVVMLIGASVFAIIISNMSQIVASLQAEDASREQEIQDVLGFLRSNRCPRALEFRVQGYFEFKNQQSKFHSRLEDVVGDIPQNLADQINVSILWPILKESSIFDGIPRQCVLDLAIHLQPSTKLPGELVFKHGHESSSLFILLSGEVQLHLPSPGIFIDEHLLWKYANGDIVGSPDLIFDCNRCGDAWAIGYVELYDVAASVTRDLIQRYPSLHTSLTAEITRRAKDLRGIMQLKDRSWEVIDLSHPIPRWLYLSCRLSCKMRADLEAAAKGTDLEEAESSGWPLLSTGGQPLMPSLNWSIGLVDAIEMLVQEERDDAQEGITEPASPKRSSPSVRWLRDHNSSTCSKRSSDAKTPVKNVSTLRCEEQELLRLLEEDSEVRAVVGEGMSPWERLALRSKILQTGIKVAVETTRQHMSAGGRRRSGANSEDGADVLSQHVAHQRAFAALESQVAALHGRAKGIRATYLSIRHSPSSSPDAVTTRSPPAMTISAAPANMDGRIISSVPPEPGAQWESNGQERQSKVHTFRVVGHDERGMILTDAIPMAAKAETTDGGHSSHQNAQTDISECNFEFGGTQGTEARNLGHQNGGIGAMLEPPPLPPKKDGKLGRASRKSAPASAPAGAGVWEIHAEEWRGAELRRDGARKNTGAAMPASGNARAIMIPPLPFDSPSPSLSSSPSPHKASPMRAPSPLTQRPRSPRTARRSPSPIVLRRSPSPFGRASPRNWSEQERSKLVTDCMA